MDIHDGWQRCMLVASYDGRRVLCPTDMTCNTWPKHRHEACFLACGGAGDGRVVLLPDGQCSWRLTRAVGDSKPPNVGPGPGQGCDVMLLVTALSPATLQTTHHSRRRPTPSAEAQSATHLPGATRRCVSLGFGDARNHYITLPSPPQVSRYPHVTAAWVSRPHSRTSPQLLGTRRHRVGAFANVQHDKP